MGKGKKFCGEIIIYIGLQKLKKIYIVIGKLKMHFVILVGK